jgi:hypothetical protein
MPYTIVTGDAVYPSDVPYQKISLDGDINLFWASSFPSENIATGFIKVTPTGAGFSIYMPDATLASIGASITFGNFGSDDFEIKDYYGTTLYTMTSGLVLEFKLDDNALVSGSWVILPVSGNYTGITSLTIDSSDGSIKIQDGTVTPTGGTVDIKLDQTLADIPLLNSGFIVIDADEVSSTSVSFVAGTNIQISNPNGTTGNPTISLSSNLTNISSAVIGSMTLNGYSILTPTKSTLGLNGVLIDENQNITNVNSITGQIRNEYIAKAWVMFTDGLSGISIEDSANIDSVTRVGNGRYRVNFLVNMANTSYCVQTVPNTNVTNMPSVLPNIYHSFCTTRNVAFFDIVMLDASGSLIDAEYGLNITVYSSI